MAKRNDGKTASGKPITDELVRELSGKAEAGFDVDEIVRRRGGRPPMGPRPRASNPSVSSPSCARRLLSARAAIRRPCRR